MFKAFGPLLVTIKNTYQRGGSVYYQRAIPKALHGRYPSKLIKINLGKIDLATAARKVAALNKRFEAEWAGLLAAPDSSPQALKSHATALLQQLPLPVVDLGRVELELLAQLGHGLVLAQRRLGLEGWTVGTAAAPP